MSDNLACLDPKALSVHTSALNEIHHRYLGRCQYSKQIAQESRDIQGANMLKLDLHKEKKVMLIDGEIRWTGTPMKKKK